MDQIIKKGISILLVSFLSIMTFFIPVLAATDFEGNETYWDGVCSTVSGYKDNKSECDSYETYLNNKKKEMEKNLSSLKDNINDISGSIQEDEKLVRDAAMQIEKLNDEIAGYKSDIITLESKVTALEKQIAARIQDIEEKKEMARNYMMNIQSTTRVNAYIDFIFGAEDFSEVSRRIEGMNLINEKNQDNIRVLNEEKEKLEEDKIDLDFQKKSVQKLVERQEERLEYQKELQDYAEKRVEILRKEYQSLLLAQRAAEEERKLAVQRIDSIGPIESTSGGMSLPIAGGSYYVSARPWNYSSGEKHLGVDFAARIGTSLQAPANGVVIATNNGCPTWGSLSNGCGKGYGNYIVMIVNVDNQAYGVLYAHLQNGGVHVGPGQKITNGQIIGKVGSSGMSTGPHLHAEIFYLGYKSVDEAYNEWWNGPRNIQFGLGGSSSSIEYGNRCSVNGMNAPCRMNPATYWGV